MNDSAQNKPSATAGTTGKLSAAAQAIASELSGFRSDMLRFAVLQLRNRESAEDAVQEATIAALTGAERFAERAKLKTWVFSILKNKIIDIIRRRVRESAHDDPPREIEDGDFDPLFTPSGHWQIDGQPAAWGDPEKNFENQRFWQVFDTCLNRLPSTSARVFMMRELLGLETNEICQELSMSSNNCWVILHRARMNLRLCLEQNWFVNPEVRQ
ncbi:MAG: sigma-70 family RNA polymerase sigma factor [Candidatus Accumulibacter sp.]|nr:sigma-70 family RNA polymerase sigma factor [Accumulibacter sp.]